MSNETVERVIPLKWFHFSQNNSGGFFVENDDVCEEVFIQAESAAAAIVKAETFCDNSDSCPCCGDRWSFYVNDDDGTPEPTIYGEPISSVTWTGFRKKAKLHFVDGRTETYNFAARQEQPK